MKMEEIKLTAIEKMGYIEKTDRERLIERIVYEMMNNVYEFTCKNDSLKDKAKLIVDENYFKGVKNA